MPEGDTLYRAARELGARLDGATVTAFSSVLGERVDQGRVGRTIARVVARGKNLLVQFDDGWTLHTHLRMSGRWRLAPVAVRAPYGFARIEPRERVVIATAEWVAVCSLAPVVRLLRGDGTHELGLGPDLLADSFDADAAVRALRAGEDLPIGDAVMVQGRVAGIGNVYKSEVLFLESVDPFRRISTFDDATLTRVLTRARSLMQANVRPGSGMRATRLRPDARATTGRLYVYRRSGEPCFRCGTRVAMRRQRLGRSTYFCPTCQAVPLTPGARPMPRGR